MPSIITEAKIKQVLDWAYEKAVSGVPGIDSAEELAKSYMNNADSNDERASSLIRWQNTKAATSGFITGLGGIMTLPVAMPANITSVLYIQIRMVAAIAYIYGADLKCDQVRTLVYACLVAQSAKEVLKNVGVQLSEKMAINAVKAISGETIKQINKMVGFKLLTKFGQGGVINLGKAIPLLGGVLGGSFDAYTTNAIGNVARKSFTPKSKI